MLSSIGKMPKRFINQWHVLTEASFESVIIRNISENVNEHAMSSQTI